MARRSSALGSVVGIVLGIDVISVSPLAVVGSFLFSAAVGSFSGFYPARKAKHLEPIAALRHDR